MRGKCAANVPAPGIAEAQLTCLGGPIKGRAAASLDRTSNETSQAARRMRGSL